MILVDTSVWVDHLRSPEPTLVENLERANVLIHPMVIGELACGNLVDRRQRLDDWGALPRIAESTHEEVMAMLESRRLTGRGIGFIDAHLLCAALREGALLWTRDASLRRACEACAVAFPEPV